MSAPVGNTCPDIDKVISGINDAKNIATDFIKNLNSKSIDDIEYSYSEIENNLEGLESILEELRSSNSKLREWGIKLEEDHL